MVTGAKLKDVSNRANGKLSSPIVAPADAIEERKARMWNMWTRTSRCGGGVITHVFEEGTEKANAGRSICGARYFEGGMLNMLYDDYEPGCFRCRKMLHSWGLLAQESEGRE